MSADHCACFAFADFEAEDGDVPATPLPRKYTMSAFELSTPHGWGPNRGWLTYDPAEIAKMAQHCAANNVPMGCTFIAGDASTLEHYPPLKEFKEKIEADYTPVEGVTLRVGATIDQVSEEGVVTVRFAPDPRPQPPEEVVLMDDRVVIYTNRNVPQKKYRSLVPTEPTKPENVVVYASDTYGYKVARTMRRHKARRRVMCGKFPLTVKTDVLPALEAMGVTVDTTAATFV